jgi:hypothetical protein
MKNLAATLALAVLGSTAFSQELATCKEPAGYAYFPKRRLVTAKDAGWQKDKISAGLFTLRKVGEADYDILYVDATKQVHSTKGEGGVVKLLRSGDSEMTFILFYPGSTIELYTFMRDSTGLNQLGILTSRGGDGLVQYKQSALVANCSAITFVASPTKAG